MSIRTETINFALITIVGLVIVLFMPAQTTENGSSGPASSAIWGYGAMACGVFGITMLLFHNKAAGLGGSVLDYSFWKTLLQTPALILLVIIIWQVAMYTMYFKKINQGKVPPQFSSFSSISSVLIFTQTVFLVHIILQKLGEKMSGETEVSKWHSATTTAISLLNVASIFISIIMTIIMQFYTTDG